MNKNTKLELMLYALKNDYFDYGTRVYKRKDTYYIHGCYSDEKQTKDEIIENWDLLDSETRKEIIADYRRSNNND